MLSIKRKILISIFLLFFNTYINSESLDLIKYENVLIEIKDILKENHFKKNVSVSLEEIQKKYLDSIDSQKMIFTDDDFKNFIYDNDSSYLSQIEFAFNIFNVFKDKSINFLEIQRKAISNINSEIQLDTNSFIYKDREDLSRFENQDELSFYHINEASSELISILLKEKRLEWCLH